MVQPRYDPLERAEIAERGGRRYRVGTVYYSKESGSFLRAGMEQEGPLTLEQSARGVRWSVTRRGQVSYRDQTGAFIPNASLSQPKGVFLSLPELTATRETITGDPSKILPDLNQQIVEYHTVLRPDGSVRVVRIGHSLGGRYNIKRRGSEWYAKMSGTLGLSGTSGRNYAAIREAIIRTEVVLETITV